MVKRWSCKSNFLWSSSRIIHSDWNKEFQNKITKCLGKKTNINITLWMYTLIYPVFQEMIFFKCICIRFETHFLCLNFFNSYRIWIINCNKSIFIPLHELRLQLQFQKNLFLLPLISKHLQSDFTTTNHLDNEENVSPPTTELFTTEEENTMPEAKIYGRHYVAKKHTCDINSQTKNSYFLKRERKMSYTRWYLIIEVKN